MADDEDADLSFLAGPDDEETPDVAADLAALAEGGEEIPEEEELVSTLIAIGERHGVDLSSLAQKAPVRRRPGDGPTAPSQTVDVDQQVDVAAPDVQVENEIEGIGQLIGLAEQELAELLSIGNNVGFIAQEIETETDPRPTIRLPTSPTYTVPANTRSFQEQDITAGVIQSVVIDYRNTQSLVDVRVEMDGNAIVPHEDADANWETHHQSEKIFNVNAVANGSVTIRAVWRNRDSQFAHIAPVDVSYTPG